MLANVELRRAADRAVTTTPWLKSRHSFSFGDHYDPDNTHHGLLLVNNDDSCSPQADSIRTRTGTWRSSPGYCGAN